MKLINKEKKKRNWKTTKYNPFVSHLIDANGIWTMGSGILFLMSRFCVLVKQRLIFKWFVLVPGVSWSDYGYYLVCPSHNFETLSCKGDLK